MNTDVLLTALGVAIGAGVLIVGLFVFSNRRRLEDERALRDRLSGLASSGASRGEESGSVSILRKTEVSDSYIDKLLSATPTTSVIERDARAAGLAWTTGQFAGFVLAGAMLGVLSAFFLDWTLAVAVGLIGVVTPFIVLASKKARRLRSLETQLPEAVDMLVNSLRAGYSLQAGMNFVGSELPAPIGPEFSRFYDEQRLGVDVRQALQSLTERLGTLDGRMFVLAIIIQRETGGNLSEILGNISSVIRERIMFREQLDVLTAESKLSAVLLTLLPVVMFFAIKIMNPDYMEPMTNTETGKAMLLGGAVSLAVGYVVLRKMSIIEV
jgi:tight adherence protein B